MTGHRRIHGFTLIEVMVATVIFLLFIGTVYGVYHAANAAMVRAEEQADIQQTGRVLLAQLNAELTSAYQSPTAPTCTLVGEDTSGTSDEMPEDTLTFLTTAHAAPSGQPAGDLCQVSYAIARDGEDGTPGLYLEENFHPGLEVTDIEPTRRLLSPLVVGMNCKYLAPDADDWAMDWVDQTTLPIAVRIELTLQPERQTAKPIVVVMTANPAMATRPAEGAGDVQP